MVKLTEDEDIYVNRVIFDRLCDEFLDTPQDEIYEAVSLIRKALKKKGYKIVKRKPKESAPTVYYIVDVYYKTPDKTEDLFRYETEETSETSWDVACTKLLDDAKLRDDRQTTKDCIIRINAFRVKDYQNEEQ